MDFQSWLRRATGALSDSESPKRDAEILLEYVTGKARTYLLAFGETELTVEQEAQLSALLARRKTGEPVAHLVGGARVLVVTLVRLSGDADPTSRHRMSGGAGAGAVTRSGQPHS